MSKNTNEAIRWLEIRMEKKPKIISFVELDRPEMIMPDFVRKDIDEAYREGFEEGFDYCIRQFEELYTKKGFVRVREIANMLWHWSSTVLMPWKAHGQGKFRNHESHPPHPVHIQKETWTEIRERTIRRDGECVRCGDVINLEVDHIYDVQHGGRPIDDNLRTLCKVCHKGKSHWSTTR